MNLDAIQVLRQDLLQYLEMLFLCLVKLIMKEKQIVLT
jgi:hypothetical protein